jgi:hypothetical protein
MEQDCNSPTAGEISIQIEHFLSLSQYLFTCIIHDRVPLLSFPLKGLELRNMK